MRRAGMTLVVLAAVGVCVAGCGGGSDSAAERAAQDYVDGYNAHDFERVCKLLSDSYKADLLAGEGEEIRCPEWFEEHTSGSATTLTLVDVEENGDQATAHVRSESADAPGAQNDLALRVARQPNGTWRVVDLTTAPPSSG
jgi:ketosteroid isomerase-like protein